MDFIDTSVKMKSQSDILILKLYLILFVDTETINVLRPCMTLRKYSYLLETMPSCSMPFGGKKKEKDECIMVTPTSISYKR